MYEIYRNNLTISSNIYDGIIDSTGASNVPFSITNVAEDDEYSNAEIQLHYEYRKNKNKFESAYVKASSDGYFYLPGEVFLHDGVINLSVKYKISGGIRSCKNSISCRIVNTPNGNIVLENLSTDWEQMIDDHIAEVLGNQGFIGSISVDDEGYYVFNFTKGE